MKSKIDYIECKALRRSQCWMFWEMGVALSNSKRFREPVRWILRILRVLRETFRDHLLRVFVFENLQIVTNSPKGHDDLTGTKSQCHKGFRKKNIRKICLCIEKKTYFCENSGKMVKKVCLIRIYVL